MRNNMTELTQAPVELHPTQEIIIESLDNLQNISDMHMQCGEEKAKMIDCFNKLKAILQSTSDRKFFSSDVLSLVEEFNEDAEKERNLHELTKPVAA